jgi:hypothetical protein
VLSEHPGAQPRVFARAAPPACPRCGAPLVLKLFEAEALCRHCGRSVEWEEELQTALVDYQALVVALVRQDYQARFAAEVLRRQAALSRPLTLGFFSVLLSVAALVATTGTRASAVPVALFVPWMLVWIASLVQLTRTWLALHRVSPPTESGARGVLRCEACGAERIVEPGEATVPCRHCHAELVVPRGLAHALGTDVLASADRSATRRAEALAAVVYRGSGIGPGFVGFVILLAFGIAVVYGERSHQAKLTIELVWVTMALTGGPAVAIMSAARQRARRLFEEQAESFIRRVRVLPPAEPGDGLIVFDDPATVPEDATEPDAG